MVSQSSSRPPQRNPRSGHPCNNMAATGERDKERQTNGRKKERKQRVSNRIGRYGHMLSPSSVTSLRVTAIFIFFLLDGFKTFKRQDLVQDRHIPGVTSSRHVEKAASHLSLKHAHFCHCRRNVLWKILQRVEGTYVCFTPCLFLWQGTSGCTCVHKAHAYPELSVDRC